ncbi:MAG: hypothetical protein R3C45_18775 [Phycisphaerales bacterium]
MKHWPYLLTALVMLVIFGCRWFGPSDLYDNDQPKTVAYTIDMVEHGRWLLPVDMLGRPATKPPMYNWIGALFVAVGWHDEFALKLPSTLAALFVLVLTWRVASRAARDTNTQGNPFAHNGDATMEIMPASVAALACIVLMTGVSFAKLCYTARPDMVLTAFLFAGWAAATSLLYNYEHNADVGESWAAGASCQFCLRIALWLCVAGAALTKGLPALLLILYVLLGAKLVGGRWSALWSTGIVWGLPMACALFGAWVYGVYRINPEHFTDVFMGDETVGRVGRGGLIGIVLELWKMPGQFVVKFLPWSLIVFMAGWDVVSRRRFSRWFSGAIGSALLWVVLTILFFSFSGGKRADYLTPAYPVAAVVVAVWLTGEGRRRWRIRAGYWAVAGLVVALAFGVHEFCIGDAARSGYGENIRMFVRQIHHQTRGQPIRFEQTAYTPIQSLLGYNQPDRVDPPDVPARWLVRPADRDGAVVISDPIWVGGRRTEIKMALYPNDQVDK